MSVGDITSNIMLAVKGRSDTGMIEQGLAQLTMHVNALKSSLSKAHAQIGVLNKRLAGFQNQTKQNTKTTRGFKIELMAMMFFWRQIGGAALGLLQPAAEAFGLFELWSQTLLVTFIPVMELISPILYEIMDSLMNMPDWLKLLTGGAVLLVAGFSSLVVIGGILSAALTTLGFTISGLSLLLSMGLVAGILLAIGWIFKIKEEMGGWGAVTINVGQGIINWYFLLGSVVAQACALVLSSMGKVMQFTGPFGKAIGDQMIVVSNEIKSANENVAIALSDWQNSNDKWAINTQKNNLLVADSYNKLALDMSSALERIRGVYGEMFGMQVQSAVSSNKKAKGALSSLGYDSAAAKSPGVTTVPGSYKTNPNAKKMNDFVWRAGEGAVSISPDDNLVGTKKGTPGMNGSGVIINQTINVGIAGRDEITRMIAENNKKLTADIQRIIG